MTGSFLRALACATFVLGSLFATAKDIEIPEGDVMRQPARNRSGAYTRDHRIALGVAGACV